MSDIKDCYADRRRAVRSDSKTSETKKFGPRSTSEGDLPLIQSTSPGPDPAADVENDDAVVQPGAFRYTSAGQLQQGVEQDIQDESVAFCSPPQQERVVSNLDPTMFDLDHPVIARAVSEDSSTEIVTAEGVERESFFQNKNRTRSVLAIMLVLVCALAVGLGVALSGKSDSDSTEESQPSIFAEGTSPIDGEPGSGFGSSVSLCGDGTRLAIAGPGTGIVQVFKLNADMSHTQIGQTFTHEPTMDWSALVRSPLVVELTHDCNVLAIGSPYENANGLNNSGQVALYQYNSGSDRWEPLGSPNTISGLEAGDFFAESLSLSRDGGKIAVGSPGSGPNGEGQVRVFQINRDSWDQLGETLNGTFANQAFGKSVSFTFKENVDFLAVGSITGTSDNIDIMVQVFEFQTGAWADRGSKILADSESLAGTAVSWMVRLSLDGQRLVMSSLYANQDGKVAVDRENKNLLIKAFEFQGEKDDWVQLGRNIHQNVEGAKSGYIITLSDDGKQIGMGDPGTEDAGGLTGHAHFFELNDREQWCQIGADIEGAAAGDLAGFDVSISGDGKRLAMGSPRSRAGGNEHGRVQVFDIADHEGVEWNCDT